MTSTAVASDDDDLSRGTDLNVTITRGLNALALMLAGATDAQIARQLGFANAREARRSWESLLAETVTTEEKDKVRKQEVARLDRMHQSWWSKAIDPASAEHVTAGRMILSIMERRARLLGLDAPTRVEVYTPSMQEIQAYVTALRAQAGVQDEVEPDILELDSTVLDEQAS